MMSIDVSNIKAETPIESNLYINSNSNNFSRPSQSFSCESCNLLTNSKISYEQHLLGQKHKKNSAKFSSTKNFTNDEFSSDLSIEKNDFFIQNDPGMAQNPIEKDERQMFPKSSLFKCEYCQSLAMEEKMYLLHLSGKKHLKKLKSLGINENESNLNSMNIIQNSPFRCDTCNLNFITKDILASHLAGKKHLKKLNDKQHPVETKNQENIKNFNCELCDLKFASNDQLKVHLVGKKHVKKSNSSEKQNEETNQIDKPEPVEYKCEICDLKLLSKDQLEIHLVGKKHMRKLSSISSVAANKVTTKNPKEEDDSKFSQLNIAWDKYRIDASMKEATDKKYEFYCSLCSKYLQRKLQLVDHLKSKKHHRKIFEKRQKENQLVNGKISLKNSNDILPRFKKTSTLSNFKSQKNQKFSKGINFVPASSSFKSTPNPSFPNTANQAVDQAYMASQYTNSNNQQQDQPQPNNPVAYPLMQYYQTNQQSLQPKPSNLKNKRKSDQVNSAINPKLVKTEIQQDQNYYFNYSNYGYGNDQNCYGSTSADTAYTNQPDVYWKTPTSNLSEQNLDNTSSQPNQYQNFTYNVLSNITSLQYATACAQAQSQQFNK